MNIFIADLDENAAAFGEEFAGDGEPVAEVGEIGMDAEFPGVAEGAESIRICFFTLHDLRSH